MRLVIDSCDFYFVDINASRNSKDFVGSTNGSLASFLGIPFAQPPYVSVIITRSYRVLTSTQYRKQAF
jgi:carboxylesterase type B